MLLGQESSSKALSCAIYGMSFSLIFFDYIIVINLILDLVLNNYLYTLSYLV